RTPPATPAQGIAGAVDLVQVIAVLSTTQLSQAGRLAAAVDEARSIDQQAPEPMLAPAIADGTGLDERIHIRGNPKNPGAVVPRRFLEVLGGCAASSAPQDGSGRLELARQIVDPGANPLLARVLVNRLWKHHFGEGLVKSTDDFGAM